MHKSPQTKLRKSIIISTISDMPITFQKVLNARIRTCFIILLRVRSMTALFIVAGFKMQGCHFCRYLQEAIFFSFSIGDRLFFFLQNYRKQISNKVQIKSRVAFFSLSHSLKFRATTFSSQYTFLKEYGYRASLQHVSFSASPLPQGIQTTKTPKEALVTSQLLQPGVS